MLVAPSPRNPFSMPTGSDHTRSGSPVHQPAKDMPAFKALLSPPIEFVQGSSTGALAVPEGKYQAINQTPPRSRSASPAPTPEKTKDAALTKVFTSQPTKIQTPTATSSAPAKAQSIRHQTPERQAATPKKEGKSLYSEPIELTWPPKLDVGSGLHNTGNSCFLNSVLQCLLHTPPLIRLVAKHTKEDCMARGFCMTCGLRKTMLDSYKGNGKRAFVPTEISSKLQAIAKHLRRGRQEDAHEFLRYAVDGLQKSCLAGHPPKINPKLAETTWVHQLFAGRLRSRVSCDKCGHNSDTFDTALDLSIDIAKINNLKDALKSFVAVDILKGADKYKCEKCKVPVSAKKRFTVHDAPKVLTIHLKRFSPLGRKIGHAVQYDERISLKPMMSEGQHGPTYTLYGVICHAGGGPNSGHYYAHIKSGRGQWYEMNDDDVSTERSPPLNRKTAYILFYLQDQPHPTANGASPSPHKSVNGSPAQINGMRQNVIAGMKKRKKMDTGDEDKEEGGSKSKKPFIGPMLPPSLETQRRLSTSDPQAEKLKQKIAKQKKTLVDYESDGEKVDSSDDIGVPVARSGVTIEDDSPSLPSSIPNGDVNMNDGTRSSAPPATSSPTSSAPPSPSTPKQTGSRKSAGGFYGCLPRPKRTTSSFDTHDDEDEHDSPPRSPPKPLSSATTFRPQNGSTPNKKQFKNNNRRNKGRDGENVSPRKQKSSFSHHNPYSAGVTNGKTYGRKKNRPFRPT